MALKADSMDVDLASAVQEDMTSMLKEERALREKINRMVSSSLMPLFFFFISA